MYLRVTGFLASLSLTEHHMVEKMFKNLVFSDAVRDCSRETNLQLSQPLSYQDMSMSSSCQNSVGLHSVGIRIADKRQASCLRDCMSTHVTADGSSLLEIVLKETDEQSKHCYFKSLLCKAVEAVGAQSKTQYRQSCVRGSFSKFQQWVYTDAHTK